MIDPVGSEMIAAKASRVIEEKATVIKISSKTNSW